MSAFSNPFQGKVQDIIDDKELAQAIRLNIAGELEAIYIYDAHIRATNNKQAKKILSSIRDEEKIHVSELYALLKQLDPDEEIYYDKGIQEVNELILSNKKDLN